jgi:hypothetical protein
MKSKMEDGGWRMAKTRLFPSSILHSPSSLFPRRAGRSTWAVLAFLLLFAILIVGVSEFYLLPALAAVKDANPVEKARLSAYSRLLLAVVLFVLFVGLVLTFRIGRFFFPRADAPKTPTKYVDAWTEAGRRIKPDRKDHR